MYRNIDLNEKERTVDTQEVADSSSAEPTTAQRLTDSASGFPSSFERLIHPKPVRVGVYLACLDAGPHGTLETAVNVAKRAEIFQFPSEGRPDGHKQTGCLGRFAA